MFLPSTLKRQVIKNELPILVWAWKLFLQLALENKEKLFAKEVHKTKSLRRAHSPSAFHLEGKEKRAKGERYDHSEVANQIIEYFSCVPAVCERQEVHAGRRFVSLKENYDAKEAFDPILEIKNDKLVPVKNFSLRWSASKPQIPEASLLYPLSRLNLLGKWLHSIHKGHPYQEFFCDNEMLADSLGFKNGAALKKSIDEFVIGRQSKIDPLAMARGRKRKPVSEIDWSNPVFRLSDYFSQKQIVELDASMTIERSLWERLGYEGAMPEMAEMKRQKDVAQRLYAAQKARERYSRLSPEEKKADSLRAKGRLSRRMTPEQIDARRASKAQRARERYSNLTPGQLEVRRSNDARKKREAYTRKRAGGEAGPTPGSSPGTKPIAPKGKATGTGGEEKLHAGQPASQA